MHASESDLTTPLERLEALSRLVSGDGAPAEILVRALQLIQRWYSGEWCSVFVPGADHTRFVVAATTDLAAQPGAVVPAAEALAAQIAETEDVQVGGNLIGAPVLCAGKLHGVVLVQADVPMEVGDTDVRTLALAAAHLAPVLAAARGSHPFPAESHPDDRLRTPTRRTAHALNNSLMTIVGHAELMLEDVRRLQHPDLEEGCLTICRSGYEAARLIQQLLDVGAPGGDTPDTAEPAGATVNPVAIAPALGFGAHRVLVVDDDDRMLELIEAVLHSRLGCRVDRARNGADAAAALDQSDFNLVLSDILMPRMNGAELLQWVDAYRPEVAPRIVFMTGDANPAGPSGEVRRSGRPVLAKPFSMETLVAAAKRVLEQPPG